MDILFSIALPVIVALIVATAVYYFLRMFFKGKREEYKIISIAAAFIIAIFAGAGSTCFLD